MGDQEIESIESKQEPTAEDGIEEVSNDNQPGNVAVSNDGHISVPLVQSDDDEDFKLSKPRGM
jgi:hypothetical protein